MSIFTDNEAAEGMIASASRMTKRGFIIRRKGVYAMGAEHGFQLAMNLEGAFRITDQCLRKECFLVDDIIDSGWTFTIASAMLRKSDCTGVFPLALAQNTPGMG